MPGDALMRYTVPMPDDSLIPGKNAEQMARNGSVLSTVKNGGVEDSNVSIHMAPFRRSFPQYLPRFGT